MQSNTSIIVTLQFACSPFGLLFQDCNCNSKSVDRIELDQSYIFQFLNDKIHNYVLFDIFVNFIIQKLKNKHTFAKLSNAIDSLNQPEREDTKPNILHLTKLQNQRPTHYRGFLLNTRPYYIQELTCSLKWFYLLGLQCNFIAKTQRTQLNINNIFASYIRTLRSLL